MMFLKYMFASPLQEMWTGTGKSSKRAETSKKEPDSPETKDEEHQDGNFTEAAHEEGAEEETPRESDPIVDPDEHEHKGKLFKRPASKDDKKDPPSKEQGKPSKRSSTRPAKHRSATRCKGPCNEFCEVDPCQKIQIINGLGQERRERKAVAPSLKEEANGSKDQGCQSDGNPQENIPSSPRASSEASATTNPAAAQRWSSIFRFDGRNLIFIEKLYFVRLLFEPGLRIIKFLGSTCLGKIN